MTHAAEGPPDAAASRGLTPELVLNIDNTWSQESAEFLAELLGVRDAEELFNSDDPCLQFRYRRNDGMASGLVEVDGEVEDPCRSLGALRLRRTPVNLATSLDDTSRPFFINMNSASSGECQDESLITITSSPG